MSEQTKRYWWLKLREDFFDQTVTKKLRRLAGGAVFTIIYLKMQLLSLRNDGVIVFEGVEDSFEEELALRLDENVEDVQMTVLFLRKHSLIEMFGDTEYMLPEAVRNIDSESSSAARMRNLRERRRVDVSQCDTIPSHCSGEPSQSGVGSVTCDTEKERDKEQEKDKTENIARAAFGDQNISSVSTCDQSHTGGFERFWSAYPRRVGKQDALKAWGQLNPDDALVDLIVAGLERWKACDQWTKEDGAFICYPATFLRGRRWEEDDRPDVPPAQPKLDAEKNYDDGEDFLSR